VLFHYLERGVSSDMVVGEVVHTSCPCCPPLVLSSNVASTHNPPYEQRLIGMDSGVVLFVVCCLVHGWLWMAVGCSFSWLLQYHHPKRQNKKLVEMIKYERKKENLLWPKQQCTLFGPVLCGALWWLTLKC
jgi:hypothetical protein